MKKSRFVTVDSYSSVIYLLLYSLWKEYVFTLIWDHNLNKSRNFFRKILINNFSFISYLAKLQFIFTAVINFFTNITFPNFPILARFLEVLGFSYFALTLNILLVELLQISFCCSQNFFCTTFFCKSSLWFQLLF